MSLEVNPVGMACNIACEYCYEQSMRDAGNITDKLDLTAIFRELDKEKKEFSLFGGEPLLLPVSKLEEIFEYGFKRFGSNGVQTNGTLINTVHIELFRRYNVHVGFSIDGPHPINEIRCGKELTEKSIENIKKCLSEGLRTSLIITLHTGHLGRWPVFFNWLTELDELGLKDVRLHLLERDNNVRPLNNEQLVDLLLALDRAEVGYKNIKFDLFREISKLLRNPFADVTCVWNACDPLTTSAVNGIGPSGNRYNCGRTNKEGVQWYKAENAGHERQLALYHTDCKDCRFFLACKGFCPGTGIDGDWRRKTEHCSTLKTLFNVYESKLISSRIPVYTQDKDLKEKESEYLNKLINNKCTSGDKNCKDNNHSDWHVDTNAEITYTGNVPVKMKK